MSADPRARHAPAPGPDLRLWTWALRGLRERPDETLGVELHLPFCQRRCLYCGHDVDTAGNEVAMRRYAQALLHEMDLVAAHLGRRNEVVQVHFGGGTPNELPPQLLGSLVQGLRQRLCVPADAQWSIECDPRRCSQEQLLALRRLGFSHLRLGLPDLSPAVQAAAGRVQSLELMHDVMDLARQARMRSVQLDLVCGLPLQTPGSWERTLQQLLGLGPDRIQCVHYLHRPARWWNQCAIGREQLPGLREQQEMWAMAADAFTACGYRWIGGGLFVLDDDPLAAAAAAGELHCSALGYAALPVHHLLAFGAGRTSDVADTLASSDDSRPRWADALDQGRWPVVATHRRSARQRQRRRALRRLQCTLGLERPRAGEPLEQAFDGLAALQAQGWVEQQGDVLRVTRAGRCHMDRLCALLDDSFELSGHLVPVRPAH